MDVELEDRISCLPDHIIDQILSHLPIRHAVTTSALSKIWRYKWNTIPNLVFDTECVYAASQRCHSLITSEFLTIIDHVLLLHSGPIKKFVLIYDDEISVTSLDRWILYLTRRFIKEFFLSIDIEQPYKIPWCLFSCQSLHRIKLCGCSINPPSAFKGFRNLKILQLFEVTITQDVIENLISGCPLLEDLTLAFLYGLTQVIIHAPNLKVLDIMGDELESIFFENTSQLAKVTLDLDKIPNFESNQSRLHGCSSNLVNFFSHLPHLQNLDITSCFVKLMYKLQQSKEISAVLCLLRSSPNLRKIKLYEMEEEDEEEEKTALLVLVSYCWEDIFSEPTMPLGARHVWIVSISGTQFELDFIKFLLLYSPLLEQMIVRPSIIHVKPELVTKVNQFRRASGQAEVIYEGETK